MLVPALKFVHQMICRGRIHLRDGSVLEIALVKQVVKRRHPYTSRTRSLGRRENCKSVLYSQANIMQQEN